MLAYAIALDAAKPWLDVSVPAPSWFGSGEATSLSASDLDVAYHGFMSAPAWGLADRSVGAVEAAERFQGWMLPTEQAEGTANSEGGGGTVYEEATAWGCRV